MDAWKDADGLLESQPGTLNPKNQTDRWTDGRTGDAIVEVAVEVATEKQRRLRISEAIIPRRRGLPAERRRFLQHGCRVERPDMGRHRVEEQVCVDDAQAGP
jgi:hypothetical protein